MKGFKRKYKVVKIHLFLNVSDSCSSKGRMREEISPGINHLGPGVIPTPEMKLNRIVITS